LAARTTGPYLRGVCGSTNQLARDTAAQPGGRPSRRDARSRILKSVLVFLGIPMVAGYLSRRLGEKGKGQVWYESKFVPRIAPWALSGLLFTIVILFALQGDQITSRPLDVTRIALPLLWTDEIVRAADVVVTMGCGDACPFFPGKRYENWDLPDPTGEGIDAVRRIRDEIERHVRISSANSA
jgi:hypothetical protein